MSFAILPKNCLGLNVLSFQCSLFVHLSFLRFIAYQEESIPFGKCLKSIRIWAFGWQTCMICWKEIARLIKFKLFIISNYQARRPGPSNPGGTHQHQCSCQMSTPPGTPWVCSGRRNKMLRSLLPHTPHYTTNPPAHHMPAEVQHKPGGRTVHDCTGSYCIPTQSSPPLHSWLWNW